MLDHDVYKLWQFLRALLYDYNLNRKWITVMLLVDDSIVLSQVRCYCTSGVGMCERM